MPTWGEVLTLLKQSAAMSGGQVDFDGIRRAYLSQLHALTGRDLIIYYADWLAGGGPESGIVLEDIQAMMEVCKGLHGPEVDLLLHTPGGSAEATASIVGYLRQRFETIRVFIPVAAMSAGTMWALAADEVVMGQHSQLGPIDPQVSLQGRLVPARAIVEQFDRAKEECKADPGAIAAWYPILQQYGPGLLAVCEDAEKLSRRLVGEWLATYMFKAEDDPKVKANEVADYFADYTIHRSHALGIPRETAKGRGLRITNLEDDNQLQDLVLTVHHATMHTLGGTGVVKLVENHLGRAYIKSTQTLAIPMPFAPQLVPGGGTGIPIGAPPVPLPGVPPPGTVGPATGGAVTG